MVSRREFEQMMDTAYLQGKKARNSGQEIEACPYSIHQPYLRNCWVAGWNEENNHLASNHEVMSDGPLRPNSDHPIGGLW